jgi:hypothetical protein
MRTTRDSSDATSASARRLYVSVSLAVLFHAGLSFAGYLTEMRPRPSVVPRDHRAAEVDIELYTPAEERAREPEPPAAMPATPALAAASRLPTARRKSAPEPGTAPRAASDAAVVVESPEPNPEASEGTQAPASTQPKRLGLSELGLTHGIGAAVIPPIQQTPQERDADIGGLRSGLMARDTELGLGPGGKVADAVRREARDVAPLQSRATFVVNVDAGGAVTNISLRDATSHDDAWSKVVRILRDKIRSLTPWRGGAVQVVLAVRSLTGLRSGPSSGGPLSFDLSNIGSPELHHFHVQVLEQVHR